VTGAAIEVRDVRKTFRLFHEKNSTLKATVLRGRRAKYEEFLALDGVTFDVPEGTTFGLIGENGSGKSTLLKCMARILRPNEGEILMHGKVSALLELGAGFHGELSGRENIYLNGSILGLSKRDIDARFDEIVEFAGGEVPRFIDNPVKNYSSGMFVRLGFAIAINVQPDILLVDEILAVGDEDFQRKCMQKFAEFRKSGRTVVVVSHALDTIRNLCDHAAWLEHGVLREVGVAGKVTQAYLETVGDSRAARRALHDPDTAATGGRLIKSVQLLDKDGAPTTLLRTGEPATIRVGVECGTTGDVEVLRLEINAADGAPTARASTFDTKVVLHELEGLEYIDYEIPHVLLGVREYDLSVVLVGPDLRTDLERVKDIVHFEVTFGSPEYRGNGLVLLGGEFGTQPIFSGP
jgi:ABC-type polysaccharide/polyol phosphate transport system ATPase subunit